ncbi:SRPBCC family protein [Streptomyces roseofulvus]|uniref:SRPBCC family protein n=2 Tax=Streptomyces TaxID=1883 RepID=A0ABU4JZL5_9ACTN|nr:SRPBCC family protein [Streptomyces roseolus]MDX2290940.1 SRPBCC family protein [Streptomyces roseolus]
MVPLVHAASGLLAAVIGAAHLDSQPVTIDETAPVITRDAIVIHAPASRVWHIQTDVEGWPAWQPGVSSVAKKTKGALRPGSSWVWSTEGLENITSTVEQVERGRRIVWGGPAAGITAVHVWTFEPTEDGVIVRTEESWTGEPVDANAEYLQEALDASLDHWLHNLKHRAEQGA